MRGPGLRLKIDVRRVWRCPQCGKQRRVAATEVVVRCTCNPSQPQMQLIEPQRRVRIEHPPLPAYIEFEEILVEDDNPSRDKTVPDQIPEVAPSLSESSLSESSLSESSAVSASEVASTPADESASALVSPPDKADKEPGGCDDAI